MAALGDRFRINPSLLTRTGFPLRQVILNSEDRLPLVNGDLATRLVERMEETDAFETLPEQDQSICRMFAYYYAAGQISAGEQLRCMTGKVLGSDYLLSVIPSLKPQPTDQIVSTIQDALQRSDEDAAYGALAAALYGQT